MKNNPAHMREVYESRKAEGLCVDCGNDADRGVRCLYHALLRRLRMRKRRNG